jgi:ribosomal protein S27E
VNFRDDDDVWVGVLTGTGKAFCAGIDIASDVEMLEAMKGNPPSRVISWEKEAPVDDRFSRQYGFWRPYIEKVICRYLDCRDLHNGFARIRCKDCGHEYLLAFSCKRRHFCPSCHQKRVVEFGEWLCLDVLKKVPHRHFIFSITKILRRYFL